MNKGTYANVIAWPPCISDGTLEGLKWVALISMVYDHGVRFVLAESGMGEGTAFGRLAFPLFAFILAYNMARPGVDEEKMRRWMVRLLIFGLLAIPAHWTILGPGRLNILFTLAVALGVVWLLRKLPDWRGRGAALIVTGLMGGFVEYGWFGILFVVGCYLAIRTPRLFAGLSVLALSFIGLSIVNISHWGTLALLLIGLAPFIHIPIPRMKWVFYFFYPAHLTAIALSRLV